mgnify:CR=1 FL=1
MSQFFVATTALLLSIGLWSLGKRPITNFLSKTDQNSKFRSKRDEIELIVSIQHPQDKTNSLLPQGKVLNKSCLTTRDRILLTKNLQKLMNGSPENRLEAIRNADLWKHKSMLPFLRRGLKDSNSEIVIASAKAISKYKGDCLGQNLAQETLRPPRNVARIR